MEFKNLTNEVNKKKGVKTTSTTKVHGKKILIGDVTFLVDETDTEEDYDTLKTLQDVLALYRKKPNVILGVDPPLYSAFVSSANQSIETYVDIGDQVVYKNKGFSPDKKNNPMIVSNVEIKSLRNMSVIIATFDDGEFSITNHLKRV